MGSGEDGAQELQVVTQSREDLPMVLREGWGRAVSERSAQEG